MLILARKGIAKPAELRRLYSYIEKDEHEKLFPDPEEKLSDLRKNVSELFKTIVSLFMLCEPRLISNLAFNPSKKVSEAAELATKGELSGPLLRLESILRVLYQPQHWNEALSACEAYGGWDEAQKTNASTQLEWYQGMAQQCNELAK